MAWMIGIDEAGYGPNLGPLVMSSVSWRVPDDRIGVNIWTLLGEAVCRKADADQMGRLLVDDSKEVHSAAHGLSALEINTIPAVAPWLIGSTAALADFVERHCLGANTGLCDECWYCGTTALPVEPRDGLLEHRARLESACVKAAVAPGPVRSLAVCTPQFNELVEEWGSKGAVLAEAFTQLLRKALTELDGEEPIHVFVDKHGGRNTYTAMLQHAVDGGMVVVRRESALASYYEVLGLGRDLHVTFLPRADAEHFPVALASMTSKYLRELFMLEFNGFWRQHLPGLAPTAGYPGDASRFLNAIRPAMAKLGIAESEIWRQR